MLKKRGGENSMALIKDLIIRILYEFASQLYIIKKRLLNELVADMSPKLKMRALNRLGTLIEWPKQSTN